MKNNIEKYVKKSSKNTNLYFLYNSKRVVIKDPLPEHVDLQSILKKIERLIPEHFLYNVDAMYVGLYQEFEDRNINALYRDGVLYISSEQDNDKDMIDDIVHEIAHAFEEVYPVDIYGDGKIEDEFLKKRMSFGFLMNYEGFKIERDLLISIEYSEELDQILLNDIGYDKIWPLTSELFINPYAITSLREYLATGFEEYFLGERSFLKEISPSIHEKITELENIENIEEKENPYYAL